MRLMVVSHTYVEPKNRSKWFALHDVAPDMDMVIVTPTYWIDPHFGRLDSPSYSTTHLRFVPLKIWGSGYLSRHIYISPTLLSLTRRFQPDIIQVEAEPWSAVYAQMIVLRRLLVPGAKMVCFSWWNTPEWKTPLYFPGSLAYKIGLSATDMIIAGNHGAMELHRKYGYAGFIVVIPQLGVDVEEYRPAPPDPELVSCCALGSSFVIGFVGRLHWHKGIETLLEAVAGFDDSSWKLLLVGDGPQRGELVARAAALGISEHVVFAGAVPRQQIPRYMSVMNVLVLPSTKEQWEQFGHVLIEAMACGIPVVGSASGEIPYIIGTAGMVFPIGDPRSLREQIVRLITHPDLAAKCRSNGFRCVQDEYSDEAIGRRLHSAYTSLQKMVASR